MPFIKKSRSVSVSRIFHITLKTNLLQGMTTGKSLTGLGLLLAGANGRMRGWFLGTSFLMSEPKKPSPGAWSIKSVSFIYF